MGDPPGGGPGGPRGKARWGGGARSPSSRVSSKPRRIVPATPSSRRGASRVVAAGKGSDAAADAEWTPSPIASVAEFAKANYFLLGMFACVFVAAACPSFGANGGPLKPEVTINKLAVRLMFLISGLSLPLDDLRSAVTNVAANALIQFFVFGFAGLATAFGIAPALTALGIPVSYTHLRAHET